MDENLRLSYDQSCQLLCNYGYIDGVPPLPTKKPLYDDEVLGLSFFRATLEEIKLDNLTLPRSFFVHSLLRSVSFVGADLSESTLYGDDSIDVAFTSADLHHCDLRASEFNRVSFRKANLRSADLRHCKFISCDFTDAVMTDVKLTRQTAADLDLTGEQLQQIDWQDSEGQRPKAD